MAQSKKKKPMHKRKRRLPIATVALCVVAILLVAVSVWAVVKGVRSKGDGSAATTTTTSATATTTTTTGTTASSTDATTTTTTTTTTATTTTTGTTTTTAARVWISEEQLAEIQQKLETWRQQLDEHTANLSELSSDTIAALCTDITAQQSALTKAYNDDMQDTIDDLRSTCDAMEDEAYDLKYQVALRDTDPGDPNLPVLGEMSTYEGQKIVALTFDDGPGPFTERLLDEMKKRNAHATFFVLGNRVNSYKNLIRRMAEEGHVVGNHSNSHKMLHKMDLVGVRQEMGKCAEALEKILGYRPCVMRCPGGNSSSVVKEYATEAGVPILYWSVDTRDWESRNKDAILKVCKQNIKDGSIVLLHDIHSVSVDAAIELMDWLADEGYTMVTVPELLYARYGEMEAGKTYLGK